MSKQPSGMQGVRNSLTFFYLFEFEQNVRNTTGSVYPEYPTRRQNEERCSLFNKKKNGMKTVIKQVVGIDVAQIELVVSLGRMNEQLDCELYAYKVFPNTTKGFASLLEWVNKQTNTAVSVQYVMEATGVYHESLAYYLADNGQDLSVVLPNKISNYCRTLSTKTITDKTASEAIARFGLERKLENWQRPTAVFKQLRQLTRERDQLVGERTVMKNQLHAEQSEADPYLKSVERVKKRIAMAEAQLREIREELTDRLNQEAEVKQVVTQLCTLPGVGLLTAITVVAETNGFELIRNKRQLTSYAGLDVREKQSGTSVKGKPSISKKGNRFLRKAMHMPALTAIRCDDRFKAVFARLVAKHGIKMKAVVAVQRKLLEMIYVLFKNKTTYDKAYLKTTSVGE